MMEVSPWSRWSAQPNLEHQVERLTQWGTVNIMRKKLTQWGTFISSRKKKFQSKIKPKINNPSASPSNYLSFCLFLASRHTHKNEKSIVINKPFCVYSMSLSNLVIFTNGNLQPHCEKELQFRTVWNTGTVSEAPWNVGLNQLTSAGTFSERRGEAHKYGLFWTHGYCLELNCSELQFLTLLRQRNMQQCSGYPSQYQQDLKALCRTL